MIVVVQKMQGVCVGGVLKNPLFFPPFSATSGKSQEGPRDGVKSGEKNSVIPEKPLCQTPGPVSGCKAEKK